MKSDPTQPACFDPSQVSTKKIAAKQRRQRNTFLDWEEAAFEKRSRYQSLILTLGYKPEHAQTSIEDFQKHRNTFFNNARQHSVLKDINEHAWTLEQGGESTGLHMHLVALYDQRHRRDRYFADQLGKYWVETATEGRGNYESSNELNHKFPNRPLPYGRATGRIDRHDFRSRNAIKGFLAGYMCKPSQTLKSETGKHIRTYGTSQFKQP